MLDFDLALRAEIRRLSALKVADFDAQLLAFCQAWPPSDYVSAYIARRFN